MVFIVPGRDTIVCPAELYVEVPSEMYSSFGPSCRKSWHEQCLFSFEIVIIMVLLTLSAALSVMLVILGCWTAASSRRRRMENALARSHGCKPPPRLLNQMPFGIDRLAQIFKANTESCLMELFLFHFRLWGDTLEHVFLGARAFATIEPANLETVLSTNFDDWDMGPRRKVMFPLFGDGIFTQEGSDWKHSRDLLRPQFHHKQYEDLDVFRDSADKLLQVLPVPGVVDLQPYFFRLSLDITTSFLFGESVNSLTASATSDELDFATAFNTAQDCVAKRMRLPDLYWLVGGPKFRQACRDVHRFADQIIDRNLPRAPTDVRGKQSSVFLETLADRTPDRKALRSQIINILVAGRDTTACLMSWTVFLLVRHPAVMDKLRREINTVLEDGKPIDRSCLRKMNYLQNVLKETLRLYPSVPVNARTSNKITLLPVGGGPDLKSPVLVPKGTALAYCPYAMHRRPEFYGVDAESFRPERWVEDMALNNHATNARWGYLPFNGGPRTCLGQDFGLTEAAYSVVRLLQQYSQITLPRGEKAEPVGVERQTMTLVLCLTNGCNVYLER